MPHVDSLLSLVHREGANELRIGTDRAPAMFASGAPKRLSIPKTSSDTLRHLMGELLSPPVAERLAKEGRAELTHDLSGVGPFQVTIVARGGSAAEIDVVFLRATKKAEEPAKTATRTPSREAEPERRVSSPSPVDEARSADRPSEAPELPALDTPMTLPPALVALLDRALAMGASDVHLATGEPATVRVHGALRMLGGSDAADMSALLDPLLDGRARSRLGKGTSVDIGASLPASSGSEASAPRLRINVFRTSKGLAAAIRVLPRGIPALEELGFPVPVSELASLPNGLVIVSGPTGCGKSTTLAALVQGALASRSIALVTLEDPIEYAFTGSSTSLVRQRQIGRDVSDFATGLRDALREDPDVILVGEMRDPESIALALTAAETGHLVLTTLHARSAAAAVERIVDACPEGDRGAVRLQLADSLRAVISQRLLPRARGDGRVLAAEVLRVTQSVASGLREGKISGVVSAMQSGKKDGMVTLERSLSDLVRRRDIALEVAKGAANDRQTLDSYLASG